MEAAPGVAPLMLTHSVPALPAQAIVLANLCVSYIMTSDNEKAEDVMRRIEKEVCVARVSVWLSAVCFFFGGWSFVLQRR